MLAGPAPDDTSVTDVATGVADTLATPCDAAIVGAATVGAAPGDGDVAAGCTGFTADDETSVVAAAGCVEGNGEFGAGATTGAACRAGTETEG